MKAAIALTFVLSLGCVAASPTYTAVAAASSAAASKSSSSSSSYSSASAYSFSSASYYSSDVCTAVGFTIREDLATCIFDELEHQFLQKKCELLNSYGVYPRDIGLLFPELQPDSLYYDIIIIGSGPAGLSALSTLAALGKKVLVVDKGYLAPAAADSLYYRSSLYASEYVNAFPGYINGVEVTKNLYTSNIFGGLSVLDTNAWNVGSSILYKQLAEINEEFAWEKIYGYYKSLECYKTYSRSVSVTTSTSTSSSSSTSASSSSSGSSSATSSTSQSTSTSTTTYEYSTSGTYSIYNSFKESYITRTLSSVFEELGYVNSASPFDLCPNKFTILPVLGDEAKPTLFPYTVFSALEQYKSNIDLALRTTVNQIIFKGPKATGVKVTTPSGQELTLYANEQVILSTGPVSTYKLLFNSGCGPEDLLAKYNIPVAFPIPSMGNGLILPPVHHGLCLKFPKGYLSNDYDSDLRNLAYAFGDYELSPTLSLNYYRAYLAVKGASEANVALKFYAFSQSTSIRLKTMMTSYFQYDSFTQEYISGLLSDYDILIVGTQLLAPLSRGLISYKDCIETPYIDLGLYTDAYDLECMLEAIEQVKTIAQTKIFLNLNAELVQFPIQNINGDFFTAEYNRQSILYHSIPSLYPAGGFPIGLDYQTAVVDKALRVIGTENLRLFSPCVSPYPLYSDSLAFSTFIGQYGAQVISNEYQGIFLDSISISSASSSVSATSATATSASGTAVSSASGTAASATSATSSSLDSRDISSVETAAGAVASSSSGSAASTVASGSSAASTASGSSYESVETGAASTVASGSSASSVASGSAQSGAASAASAGSGYASKKSSKKSSSSYSADKSNSSTVVGSNGAVSHQASSSSYDAKNASSDVASSSYYSGADGVSASEYSASAQSASVSAQEESSSYLSSGSGGVVAC